jgi:SAM-dependent methyltransferase
MQTSPAPACVVLPDGRAFLEALFGRDLPRPEAVRLVELRVESDLVTARYRLASGEARLQLRRREYAAPLPHARFAFEDLDGAPTDLVEALSSRLATREQLVDLAVPSSLPLPLDRFLPSPLRLRDGARVLELGVGDGGVTLSIAAHLRALGLRGEAVAVDIDPSREGPLRAADPTVRFVCADVWHLPPSLGVFDVVLNLGCISHLLLGRPVGALDALLGRWRHLLAPHGELIVLELDRDAGGDDCARGASLVERHKWPLLSAETLAAAMQAGGFVDVATKRSLLCYAATRACAEDYLGLRHHAHTRKGANPEAAGGPVSAGAEGPHAFGAFVVHARRAAGRP